MQDFTDHLINNLRRPPPNFDWSAIYNERNYSSLQEYIMVLKLCPTIVKSSIGLARHGPITLSLATIPGLMLTAFTRAKNAGDLAIGTASNSLAVETITKIGTTKAHIRKRRTSANSSRYNHSNLCSEP